MFRRKMLTSRHRFGFWPGLAFLALLAAGCATTEVRHRDWSAYAGPGADAFRKEELTLPQIDDPAEPVNRALDEAKHAVAAYVGRKSALAMTMRAMASAA